ncbi:uncharacterized protein LOC131639420 [Vicia villosa]|uniref:uncharacterized protein LOC131639420 n=1 Tax=Vicia villosa TaxID=3911 RepID=UPI00273CB407|nr:uncharacterized protein LOC131639420 [Vicia villosa]
MLKARNRRNAIVMIRTESGVIEGVEDVKTEIKNHFVSIFTEEKMQRPNLDNLEFKSLSDEDRLGLEEEFTREEIMEVVFECDGDRSPGPDGFNLAFIKKCWNIVGDDITEFILEFHSYAKLPKAVISSFIDLIPKVDNPQELVIFVQSVLLGVYTKLYRNC